MAGPALLHGDRADPGVEGPGIEDGGHGVRELWLVDDRSSSVLRYRRSGEGTDAGFDEGAEIAAPGTITSPQLPGFELDLNALFAPAF